MPPSPSYRPSTAHATLGEAFYDPVVAARFPEHRLRFRNRRWDARVGLDALTDEEWVAHFGRFAPLPGSFEQPLALRYHGHQFRSYNPELGDGRGFLFGQLHDRQGRLLDLGTKGSGRTPWSRQGDGRLTLKGGVREILATEMLEAQGVETSKTFSLVETGEPLVRGDEPSPTRSSVLVRLSHSHIRIGTFQRLAYLGESENIGRLLDYAVRTYMPELWREETPARAVAFLEEVCRRVARMGAGWMVAGFVHGVLNTDNINITGESFDYGPWRFLPTYDPAFTAAYFDETGLYAYGRQPDALLWNLTRLAECLLVLAPQPELERALGLYEPELQRSFARGIARRLGLVPDDLRAASVLAKASIEFLAESRAPFERFFFDWYGGERSAARAAASPAASVYGSPAFAPVREALAAVAPDPEADPEHPYFSRAAPVTLLVDDVEALWSGIAERDDWSAFQACLDGITALGDAHRWRPLLPAPAG
ncbi:protein adenylyltransferase SelO [Enterovirga sp.]|uniref:protein adenylyltransferase SelO n=1 Tax=Enterovirga sp. TaxID=2026350 RepID=UPI00261C4755|nr:YdiU family protein [Enterovirga sp.]MDB5589996.1 selenoprotein [Enterovirga sp.]